MKQTIDIAHWERRELFHFFKDFYNPTFSVTATITCTGAYQRAKERGESLFAHYLHAILHAVNAVEQLHYRVERAAPDAPMVVTRYDRIDLFTPIKVNEQGDFRELELAYTPHFAPFCRALKEGIAAIGEGSSTFGFDTASSERNLGYCTISALPKLRFTAMTHTMSQPHAVNDITLINVGKMEVDTAGERTLPIAITVHHGLVDGGHVSRFFELVEEQLR